MRNTPSDDFFIAYVGGILVVCLCLAVIWQIMESACQEKYDVYDCKLKAEIFEPREKKL